MRTMRPICAALAPAEARSPKCRVRSETEIAKAFPMRAMPAAATTRERTPAANQRYIQAGASPGTPW
ncbi:MAG: hypothetical protein SOY67_08230 [Collinsella sp.]|nr:hypothetical protein [Collinsella sp.]